MAPLRMVVRGPREDGPSEVVVLGGVAGRPFAVPREVLGWSVPALVLAALDGALPGPAATGLRVDLELEQGGETLVLTRRWRAQEIVSSENFTSRGVAEGTPLDAASASALVEEVVGPLSTLAQRLIVPHAEIASMIAAGPEARAGYVPDLHARLALAVEPVSRPVGGRLRDLLHAAHEMLRTATETLHPERPDTLTLEELVARRDELLSRLERSGSSTGRLRESSEVGRALLSSVREKHALIDGHHRGEDELRRLEFRKNLVEASRRRLDRARKALQVLDDLDPTRSKDARRAPDPAVGDALQRAVEAAFVESRAAAKSLQAEQAREGEKQALREWIARLEELRPHVERLHAARRASAKAEAEDEAATKRARHLRAELDQIEARAAVLREELRTETATPDDLEALRAEARDAVRIHQQSLHLERVRASLRESAKDLQLAKLELAEREESLEAAQREHEYRSRTSAPASEALPAIPPLIAAREAAGAVVAERTAALTAVREELRSLTTSLGWAAYQQPEILAVAAREKTEAIGRWGLGGRSASEVRAELATLAQRGSEVACDIESGAESLDRLAVRRHEAASTLRERENALPPNLREDGQLEEAIARARRELEERETALVAARSRAELAQRRLEDAESALRAHERPPGRVGLQLDDHASRRLREAGFDSREEIEEALLPDAELERLEAEVGEHDRVLHDAQARIGAGRDLAARARPDVAQVEHLVALVEHAREVAESVEERTSAHLQLVDSTLDGLDGVTDELERLEQSSGLGARRTGATPGGFEQRVSESFLRTLLARAEGRLCRWSRPWTLAWRAAREGRTEGRWLEVRDAESGLPVDLTRDVADSVLLALSLATALRELVDDEDAPRLGLALLDAPLAGLDDAALDRVIGLLREHGVPVGIPCDEGDGARRRLDAPADLARAD